MLKITHIQHSGFLVETSDCYYLFDYYRGALPDLNSEKTILVFVSHGHADHYNPEIFPLLLGMGMKNITAILANDIPSKRYPACLVPSGTDDAAIRSQGYIPAIKVYHSQEYNLPCHTHVQTLLSTDSGVAFFLTCPDGVLYHAGDLNDWIMEETPREERSQMTGSYRASVNKLINQAIDIAFLPLDPRLGKYYANGFLYFLQNIKPAHVFPMHYWDQPEIMELFIKEYPQYAEIVCTSSTLEL